MITAKIACQGKTVQSEGTDSEQFQLTFAPDYVNGRNAEWAKFTPTLSLTMNVRPEVAGHFEQGDRWTLTFTKDGRPIAPTDVIDWPDLTDRHPGTKHFVQLFEVGHLPEPMRSISLACGRLAAAMMRELGDGPELTAGLRKLREAKDCFVTQRVIDRDAQED